MQVLIRYLTYLGVSSGLEQIFSLGEWMAHSRRSVAHIGVDEDKMKLVCDAGAMADGELVQNDI